MTYRIATWNINSIRIRLPHLQRLIDQTSPDVICLQEIKVVDALFPYEDIRDMGYPHMLVHGQKSYNGVAILSKTPLTETGRMSLLDGDGSRHIAARLSSGLELHNFYVPAGGDIPDRIQNPYYGFKLDYVDAMREWFAANRKSTDAMVLVGDLNIAPLEHDVWSHKQLLKIVSHTPDEVRRLNNLQTGLQWVDSARHFTPEGEKLYSWWSYRNRDWRKSNRGRRLDHIWVTEALRPALKASDTLVDARDWEKPSDHVPVVVTIGG